MRPPAAGRAVLVAGGAGFVGSALCRRLQDAGCDVTVLTRRPQDVPNCPLPEGEKGRERGGPGEKPSPLPSPACGRGGHLQHMAWAPQDAEAAAAILAPALGGYSAVVNLAGESVVSGRWTDAVKSRILDSRIQATRCLVRAMQLAARKPGLLVNASAVGYYGPRGDGVMTEASAPGADFLASVCRRWEQEARVAEALGIRVVRLRIGLVLGQGGGALAKMLLPFKLGLGGPLGSGRQKMSWIHLEDLAGMIIWLLDQDRVAGAVNAVAPHPAANAEFSRILAGVLRRPCVLRTPGFVLRLILGEASTLLLDGQDVRPRAALERGFRFQYPELEPALRQILNS